MLYHSVKKAGICCSIWKMRFSDLMKPGGETAEQKLCGGGIKPKRSMNKTAHTPFVIAVLRQTKHFFGQEAVESYCCHFAHSRPTSRRISTAGPGIRPR